MAQPQLLYRPCAGVLVFNRRGLVLAAERLSHENSWQCPQGGVSEGETGGEAADREMFEEVGLKCGEHVQRVCTLSETFKYELGANKKLKGKYIGQELSWSLYFFPNEGLPPVDLSGLGGEPPEFRQVKWTDWEELIPTVAPFKQEMYNRLKLVAQPTIAAFLDSLGSQ